MQSNRRSAVGAAAGPPQRRAADLRLHLDRLVDALDESSLRATLKLMLAETRGAIRKKRSLIALERLDGRDTADRITRLRELEGMHAELMTTYSRQVPPEDDVDFDSNLDQSPRRETPAGGAATYIATPPLPDAFRRVALATNQEQGDSVGRISAAALHGEPARPPPPTARARQGRHAIRPAG